MDWACNVTDFPQIIDKNFFFFKIIKIIINFVILIKFILVLYNLYYNHYYIN